MATYTYTPSFGKVYADCYACDKVFTVDMYVTYHFCNYCQGSLTKR